MNFSLVTVFFIDRAIMRLCNYATVREAGRSTVGRVSWAANELAGQEDFRFAGGVAIRDAIDPGLAAEDGF